MCKNGCQRGHKKYTMMAMKSFNRSRMPMLCVDCENHNVKHDKEFQVREKEMLSLLKAKGAWHCNCKKLRRGQRLQETLFPTRCRTEKCVLAPTYLGEHRWDGKNKGVRMDDLKILHSRDCKW